MVVPGVLGRCVAIMDIWIVEDVGTAGASPTPDLEDCTVEGATTDRRGGHLTLITEYGAHGCQVTGVRATHSSLPDSAHLLWLQGGVWDLREHRAPL